MMRTLTRALLLAFSAVSATADTITVKSGEHADFTRLVFYLPAETEWTLGEGDGDYSLRITDESAFFDLDGIFDFIPRSRILEVTSKENRVDIETGCDCHARAFDYRDDIVVVDIVDGPSTGEAGKDVPEGHEKFNWSNREVPFPIFALSLEGGSAAPRRSNPGSDAGLQHVGALLGRQVSEAIVNGWAVTAPNILAQRHLAMPPRLLTEAPGIELETPIAAGPFDGELRNRRATCLPASFSDVGAWASGKSVMDAISSGRRAISQQAAITDPDAVLQLVRAYTHAGFGAEADSLVGAFQLTSRAASTAAAIARTIDWPMSGLEAELATQIHCDTAAALWGLLALSETSGIPKNANLDAAQRTLSALPVHLRRHIGPVLVQRFAAAGERERAAAAALTVSRTGQPTAIPTDTLPNTPGQAPLKRGAKHVPRADIAALISELETLASLGADVALPVRERVEATLHEIKGVPGAAELLRSYSKALTASGDAAAAVATLERLQKSAFFVEFDPEASLVSVLDAATVTAGNGEFLETLDAIYAGPLRLHAPAAVTDNVTQRVLDLGYPGLVSRLGLAPLLQAGDLRREYLARLALSEGAAEEALARLKGSTSTRAASLRAEVLEELGAFAAAAEEYLSAGNTEEAARAYWLAGAWSDAARLLAPSPRRDLAIQLEGPGNSTSSIGADLNTPVDATDGPPETVELPAEARPGPLALTSSPRIDPRTPSSRDGEVLSLNAVRQTLLDSAEFRAIAGELVRTPIGAMAENG